MYKRQAREQKQEEVKAQESQAVSEGPRKETGFVAVCAGTGLADIFKGIGADVVIEGGQTMNPSTCLLYTSFIPFGKKRRKNLSLRRRAY